MTNVIQLAKIPVQNVTGNLLNNNSGKNKVPIIPEIHIQRLGGIG